jgi:transcription antitermination factor NusG
MEDSNNQCIPWNALYVKYKSEKKVDHELGKLEIESFLPLYSKIRYYCNQKRKSRIPLISCYVFARIPVHLRCTVNNIHGVIKFVKTDNKPAIIPNEEISLLKSLVGLKEEMSVEIHNYFEVGNNVYVKYGPLAGLSGELIEKRGKSRFLMKLHSLHQAFSLEINHHQLEQIKQSKKEICNDSTIVVRT